MVHYKSYTDIEQSKKLADILPLESADMVYIWHATSDNHTFRFDNDMPPMVLKDVPIDEITANTLPCWSLAALLKYLSEIKPQEYTFTLTVSEKKWCLGLMEYGRGYIRDEFDDNPVDVCVKMIERLHELNLL